MRPLVGLGLVSYSTYLWHQPLLAFARIRALGEPPWPTMMLLVACSVALGYLSWRFVELPTRGRWGVPLPPPKLVLQILAATGSCLVVFGVAGFLSGGFPFCSRINCGTQNYARFAVDYDTSYFSRDCFLETGANSFTLFRAVRTTKPFSPARHHDPRRPG